MVVDRKGVKDLIFSVHELSKYIGVSADLIYAMVREKQIPHIRIRRRILFHRETIENWLKQGGVIEAAPTTNKTKC